MKQEVAAVPLSGPYLDGREEELVVEVLRSGRLSLGPMVDEFEERFAAAVGAPYAAAVSSGTAGLHLLCLTAGIAPGDEVITSPFSFAATNGGVSHRTDTSATRPLSVAPGRIRCTTRCNSRSPTSSRSRNRCPPTA